MPNFLINVTTRGVKGASSGIKRLSGSLVSLSKVAMVGAAGGAVALSVAMKKATDAAAEQELQERKLAQALGKNTDALLKQAGALQQTSRFGDEAIIQQQAYLASIGMSEQQIKEMIPVTLDLAAATGMSLESAVKNTAKTLSGMTGELGESVGSLKDLTAEELKAGKGIEVMRKMFKGAAENETKTFAGAMDQAKNAMGDAAESLGNLLLPMATDGAKVMKKFSEDAIDAFDFIGKIDFGKTFENMITNMGALSTLISDSFKLSFKMIPDIFRFFIDKIVPFGLNALGKLWDGIKAVAGFLWEPIGIGIQIVIAKVKNFFIGMVNFAKEQFNSLAGIANKLGADIQPMEMSKLIDTEGLSIANAEMIQLFTEGAEDNIDTFGEFSAAQAEIYKKYAEQVIVQNEEIKKSDDKLADNKGKKAKATIAFGNAEIKATGGMLKQFGALNTAAKGSAIASGRMAQAGAIVDTYAGATKAFAQGGVLGFVTGASIIAAGLANVIQISRSLGDIKAAQTGFDGIVSSPTTFLAGEAGAESVNITPLSAGTDAVGGGSSAVTVNVSGNVMSQDFVEGELADNIKEAIRRGSDFGIV